MAKRAAEWRLKQSEKDKAEEIQLIIDEKRAEHRVQHAEDMRKRHLAGFKRSQKHKEKKLQKEEIVLHEGPQFSVVLKG